jgi:glutaredoxin-like protein NrdH
LVTVYTKPGCVQCIATFRRLDAKGIEYRPIDMTEDASALEKVKSLGYLQAPVIVAGDEHWSGFDPNRIDALAH